MPTYDFACRDCDHRFEELVLGSEKVECPECTSGRLKKLPTTFAVAGSQAGPDPMEMPPGSCGTCGDPRGPGACSLN